MTRFHSTALGFILAVCSVSTHACEPGDQGCGVDKADWLMYVEQNMPIGFCADTSPYVQCARKGTPPCLEQAASAVNVCIAENEPRIPLLLNRAEASDWGSALADCTGRRMFPSLSFETKACKEQLEPAAATDDEKFLERSQEMIARSPKLTELDSELTYLLLLAQLDAPSVDPDAGLIARLIPPHVAEQLDWEKAVARQCASPACLEKAYVKRIDDIKRKLK